MKFYIASGLENAPGVKALADELISMGHEESYRWADHGSVQGEGPDRIREVAIHEMNGVLAADLVIVRLPGGRGTHTEFGIAIADAMRRLEMACVPSDRKRIIVVGKTEDETGRTCAFYLHPMVDARLADGFELVAFLRGLAAAGGVWR